MRRIQFIEIHEQAWFPSTLRDRVTDALQFGFNLLKVYAPTVPLLAGALEATAARPGEARDGCSVVDLCSGAGGPWLDLARRLGTRAPGLRILLTDKYPNLAAFGNAAAAGEDRLRFYPGSVDAKNVPVKLKGLRTLFTSFHHFAPEEAQAILQNAVDAGEGIGIFEVSRRAQVTIALVLPLVLVMWLGTPWIRPFRWSRLLWTYLVPVVPLVLWFDGVVSCLRTYCPEELRALAGALKASGYRWETGEHRSGFAGAPITYLIGYPDASREKPRSG